MTDHHGKTTTSSAVNVRPPSKTKCHHGTDYCAFAHTSVNRDDVSFHLISTRQYSTLQNSTVQYIKEQYSTVQYSTEYNKVQYNPARLSYVASVLYVCHRHVKVQVYCMPLHI